MAKEDVLRQKNISTMEEPNLANCFSLEIDGLGLSTWTGCEGLAAEFEVTPLQEGGQNGFEHKLIGRVKYGTVKLSRFLNERSAQDIPQWFSQFNQPKRTSPRLNCKINMHGSNGRIVASWTLVEALPTKWTGPQFNTDGNGLAKETLEIVHNGFDIQDR